MGERDFLALSKVDQMTRDTHRISTGWTTGDRVFFLGWTIAAIATILAFLILLNSSGNESFGVESNPWDFGAFLTIFVAGISTICLPFLWFDYRWRRRKRLELSPTAGGDLCWRCSPSVWEAYLEIERQDGRQAFAGLLTFLGIALVCGIGSFVCSTTPFAERTHHAIWLFSSLSGIGFLSASIHFVVQFARAYLQSNAEPIVVMTKAGFRVGNIVQTWAHLHSIDIKREAIPYIEIGFKIFNGSHVVDVERRIPVAESHFVEAAAFVSRMQDSN